MYQQLFILMSSKLTHPPVANNIWNTFHEGTFKISLQLISRISFSLLHLLSRTNCVTHPSMSILALRFNGICIRQLQVRVGAVDRQTYLMKKLAHTQAAQQQKQHNRNQTGNGQFRQHQQTAMLAHYGFKALKPFLVEHCLKGAPGSKKSMRGRFFC